LSGGADSCQRKTSPENTSAQNSAHLDASSEILIVQTKCGLRFVLPPVEHGAFTPLHVAIPPACMTAEETLAA